LERIGTLSHGNCSRDVFEETIKRLVSFCVHGFGHQPA